MKATFSRPIALQRRQFAFVVKICSGLLMIASFSTASGEQWVLHEKNEGFEIFAEYVSDTRQIVGQLQSVAEELSQTVGLKATGSNVQIIIFSSPQNYRDYLQHRIPQAIRRRAIFYRNQDVFQVYAYRHDDLVTDLRHEFTHAVLHQALPYIPLWIDEGLAEFFEENPDARADSSRLAGMKWRCRTGRPPNLDDLQKIGSASSMSSADYRDSWAWIHYLLNESDDSRTALRLYLHAISAGEAPGSFTEFAAQKNSDIINGMGSYFRKFRITLR